MLDLFLVADGPRDHVTVPHLVGHILGVTVRAQVAAWSRLHQHGSGSGYRRKLLFAVAQARDANAAGLVATVDSDKDPKREKLHKLVRARDEMRDSSSVFPIALGEATPHGEAWLLDDPIATRKALGLPATFQIPSVVKTKNPKQELEDLKKQSQRIDDRILEVLEDIAKQFDASRCVHAKETGFHGLQEEVVRELKPLADGCGPECRCGDACAS